MGRVARLATVVACASSLIAGSSSAALASAHGSASTPTGNDISYPQCGSAFPTGQAFGLVGVNGGLANNPNPCLGPYQGGRVATSELYWAQATSSGALAAQPRAGLYLNTADPANSYNGQPIADWPKDNGGGGSDPYGTCSTDQASGLGANSTACAWQYGWNRAQEDITVFFSNATSALAGAVPNDPAGYRWWLDIETVNSWQSGPAGEQMNDADIEGMVAYLLGLSNPSPQVGIYSTSSQWGSVTGGPTVIGSGVAGATISNMPDWIAGARRQSGAQQNCSQHAFSGGGVQLAQWMGHPFDGDVVC